MGCYIWYSKEGTGRGRIPPRPLLAVPNVTATHQRQCTNLVLFDIALLMLLAIIILYYARWQHKNKKNRAVKMKNTHNYRRKIKRKNNKIKIRIH